LSSRDLIPAPLIVGPTAGGKSALAMGVAEELDLRGMGGAEIVSADAFQIYRWMDIGTAKPTACERRRVAHHVIDIREPTQPYTVHEWLCDAEKAIAEVRGRGAVPIVAGGTHLYAKALLEGLFEGPEPDAAIRKGLHGMDLASLRAELERVDPAAAARIHPNDRRRTTRALEVFRQTGRPISEHQRQWDSEGGGRGDVLLVGIWWEATEINRRINARVKQMVEAGLVDEARGLWEAGLLGTQAREALGYKQLIEHFEGRLTLEEAVEQIKIQTRRFAKNQRTWLRRLAAGAGARAMWIEGAALNGRPSEVVDRLYGKV